ncbi:MAG: chemotaxis response regulator protein-glutamate methylesterase [Coleofasciculaceae cyanobacterium SM2_1_6]|nr:chemotaxis response regulator protein-glutamate methylesterase [Coleofasciculaceae cyanobacterium SM2_1_6]
MRIAIANDLPIAVEAMRRVLSTVPNYELAWVATNGREAVTKCAVDTPDLILMDLIMPIMDGVEATQEIMNHSPCAILMVTASVSGNAAKVFTAMGYGALDAVNTPILGLTSESPEESPEKSFGISKGSVNLLAKIATIAKLIGKSDRHHAPPSSPMVSPPANSHPQPPLIAIGVSAGGPQALVTLLGCFPPDLRAAIVIVQHMDAQFVPNLATWLDQQSPLPVQIAAAGSYPEMGKVLLAGTNDHLILGKDLVFHYTANPEDNVYRPSVDVLFDSLLKNWAKKGIAVLLTGMGRDGAKGLLALRLAGWQTIAQDQATSVVYGMPKVAAEIGAAMQILPLSAIAPACVEVLRKTETLI